MRWLLILGWLVAASAMAADPPPQRIRAEVEAVLAQAPPAPPPELLRPLHIVLIADQKDHGPGEHDYPLWQKRWRILLGGQEGSPATESQVNLYGPAPEGQSKQALAGASKVKITTAWQWPSPEQLKSADLVVMFCYRSGGPRRTWNEQRIKDLEAYLARGGGFVVIHSATYTLGDLERPEGKRVVGLTGLVFGASIQVRHGPMAVKIAAPNDPICRGLPPVIQWIDEPYWPPVGDPGAVEVLATSDETVAKDSKQKKPQPMFWTYKRGKGRVFGCVPGHFNWTLDDPYFRMLLLRGMAWAAGESPYRFDSLVLRGLALGG
jgi:type 1 glutamine amidotransferase